jgi:hypothetical protein
MDGLDLNGYGWLTGGIGAGRRFDDPFLLPSSNLIPRTLENALDLCFFLYFLNPQYASAAGRVARHFITDFDFPGDGSTEEKDEVKDYVNDELQLPLFLTEMGDEYAAYGNCFARIHFPFDRFLVDKRNGKFYAIEFFGNRAKYNWSKLTYTVPDPMDPKKKIDLPFIDRKSTDITRIRLRKLNPRYMVILHNTMSGGCKYVHRFETYFMDDIKKGRLHVVNDTPIPMLEAVKRQQDFLFDDGTIFHLKAPTISGVSMANWGLPPTIANFRNIYQIQIYRKIDEAIAMDYLLPFRLFSPPDQSGQNMNGTFNNVLMGRWNSEIRQIITNRRRDKFAMHALPFPVNYQEFGAQGKTLTPKDLIEFQTGVMFDGMAFPTELFKGTLSYQQVPTAMRIFENSFRFLQDGFSKFSQWVLSRIRAWQGLGEMKIR